MISGPEPMPSTGLVHFVVRVRTRDRSPIMSESTVLPSLSSFQHASTPDFILDTVDGKRNLSLAPYLALLPGIAF
jgi:hypothetical protein